MASSNIKEVLEGIQEVGPTEAVTFTLDTLPWGGSPSSPVCDIFDEEDLSTSLSGTLLTGSPSVLGDEITTSQVGSLTEGKIYRLTITFVSNGHTLRGYVRIQCTY